MGDIPLLDGEEWQASIAIDETDSVTRSMRKLIDMCIDSDITLDKAKQLEDELILCNTNSISNLDIDKWISFCESLLKTRLCKEASEVELMLKKYRYNYYSRHASP
jgi:hypothetical protein